MSDSLDAPPGIATVTIHVQYGAGGPFWDDVVALRQRVFSDEQGIVEAGASDSDDEFSIHAIATMETFERAGVVVAAGRIMLENQGRSEAIVAWVATDANRRRLGIGREVMIALLDEADRAGMRETILAAQRHAESFYAQLGFFPTGAPYRVRGIPHRWMVRQRPR